MLPGMASLTGRRTSGLLFQPPACSANGRTGSSSNCRLFILHVGRSAPVRSRFCGRLLRRAHFKLRAPERLAGTPGPGSRRDPQGRVRTAPSGNLCNHKPLGQPEATKPDLNRRPLTRIRPERGRWPAGGREAGSCLRLGNTSPRCT